MVLILIINSLEVVFKRMSEKGLYGLFSCPSFGKTTLLMYFANRFSDAGKKAIVFSLDFSKEQWFCIMNKMKMNTSKILVFDDSICSTEKIDQVVQKETPQVVIIDYLQLLGGDKVSSLKHLKELSNQLSIPVIFSSQLSRATGDYDYFNRRPELYDLTYLFLNENPTVRKVHEIIRSLDLILFIHRHHDCFRSIGTAHRYNISDSAELIMKCRYDIESSSSYYFDLLEYYGYGN